MLNKIDNKHINCRKYGKQIRENLIMLEIKINLKCKGLTIVQK